MLVLCFVISSALLAQARGSGVSSNAGLVCLQSASPSAASCKLFLTLFRHSQSDKAPGRQVPDSSALRLSARLIAPTPTLSRASGAAPHAPPGRTWSLGDRKTNKGRVRRGVARSVGEGMRRFVGLERRSTLVPLNVVGHFGGFRAVIRMKVRLGLQRRTRHLSRPARKKKQTSHF